MQRFINNWSAPLLEALPAGAQQCQISPAMAGMLDGLGAGDHYVATLARQDSTGREVAWEIVNIVGRAGGVLTLEREQENTLAPSVTPPGSTISVRLTAALFDSLLHRIAILETAGPPEGPGPDPIPENALTDADGLVLTGAEGDILTAGD
ncbi:hypothetical protein [Pseudomonas sp. RIT-PI-AD]|uniref:hypothetical protein n=1 Tax=Pseudomonas sp. RIT-PI-AD TaxID=3035294 RepID=UPI0021D91FEC|nr:hypothetical protein [Pseudomonas sp. RIT-PI-AD]